MTIRFEWDEFYSVGNSDIDNQHKFVFNSANSLPEDLFKKDINRIIMTFFKHTRKHFAAEEKMMVEIEYPKISEHRELHNELVTKLNKISKSSFESDDDVYVFKKFIYDWIIDHILIHDKDYFRFNRDRKIKIKDKS